MTVYAVFGFVFLFTEDALIDFDCYSESFNF